MIKTLLYKQLYEVFKSYFYDSKKNKARSKLGTIGYFVFFVIIMVGVLGGMFVALSLSLCAPLTEAGFGWLYYLLMGSIAIMLGCFGSVFNTFSALYLSKDNDLLLSMPIPVKSIMVSRLLGVYILGVMYSVIVTIPAVVVYWIFGSFSFASVIGGIVFIVKETLIILVLSCALGWVVAKLSLKFKNKSIATVLASLVFIGLYYFVYFRAQEIISDIIVNATVYGNAIKGKAFFLYIIGQMATGDYISMLVIMALVIAACFITYKVIEKSFIGIATASQNTARVKYVRRHATRRSVFRAVLSKEFGRFTASANYMLNCGLGSLFLLLLGVGLLIKQNALLDFLIENSLYDPSVLFVIACLGITFTFSMIDTASASVSLEGKTIWQAQVLPVQPRVFLYAKIMVQFLLSAVPGLFVLACVWFILKFSIVECILSLIYILVIALLNSCFGLWLNLNFPNLLWTSEIGPIKQSFSVTIAIFGEMIFTGIWFALYFFVFPELDGIFFMMIPLLTAVVLLMVLYIWISTSGAKKYANL